MIKNAIQEKYQFVNGNKVKNKKTKKEKGNMVFAGCSVDQALENKVSESLETSLDCCAFDDVNDKIYVGRNKADAEEMQRLIDAENAGFSFV